MEGATGDYHTNLSAKKDALVRNLTPIDAAYSFGFLHVKAVDDAGHDKNRSLKVLNFAWCRFRSHNWQKVEFLSRIDTMIGELMKVGALSCARALVSNPITGTCRKGARNRHLVTGSHPAACTSLMPVPQLQHRCDRRPLYARRPRRSLLQVYPNMLISSRVL